MSRDHPRICWTGFSSFFLRQGIPICQKALGVNLQKKFPGNISVRKAQGVLMVMQGREVVGFVSAKKVGQIADKVRKLPSVFKS
ncbi:MAG TPA: hypothetical protein PLZ99_01520 [Parcubacteria group bacterium]|jgi:hypothetical protein|nr:hypothetical protein [Parcubacteria group bacterium]